LISSEPFPSLPIFPWYYYIEYGDHMD
jgi:hypothetical protein